MKKQAVIATLLVFGLMAIVSSASAAGQYGPYGGNDTNARIMVDKLIAVPHDDKGVIKYTYVDNLSTSDYKFKSGNYIWFKIKVQNTSNRTLTDVKVEDVFPNYLEIFQNDYAYDASARKVTVSLGSMTAGQTKEFTLKARVLPQSQLPADKGILCLTNTVKAWSGNASDTDNTQFCIEKQVMGETTKGGVMIPPKEIPSTGAELPLLFSLAGAFGFVGAKLRRFGK